MRDFEKLIQPLSREEFFKNYYGRKFHLSTPSEAVERLFTWKDLNRLVARVGKEAEGNMILTKSGEGGYGKKLFIDDKNDDSGKFNGKSIFDEVSKGATLVFNHLQDFADQFIDIREELEQVFLERANFNLYASIQPEPGLGLHWDAHDVFVFQVEGRKFWQIYDYTAKYPVLYQKDDTQPPEGSKPLWEGYINKGQCLYLPRGMWHAVLSTGAPSLHITCGINGISMVDIITWALQSSDVASEMRKSINPNYLSQADKSNIHATSLEVLKKLASTGLIDNYWSNKKANYPSLKLSDFPGSTELSEHYSGGSTFRYCGPNFTEVFKSESGLAMIIGGQQLDISEKFADMFTLICNKGYFSKSDFSKELCLQNLSDAEIRSFIIIMHRSGLLVLADF